MEMKNHCIGRRLLLTETIAVPVETFTMDAASVRKTNLIPVSLKIQQRIKSLSTL